METNYLVVGIGLVIAFVIIIVTLVRNQKDRVNMENRLNNDYTKDDDLESDANDQMP